jgi:alpha/beta superfamily hydrolase
VVAGAEHFFAGKLDQVDAAIRAWITQRHPEIADQQL